jgi:hypothetical protein
MHYITVEDCERAEREPTGEFASRVERFLAKVTFSVTEQIA